MKQMKHKTSKNEQHKFYCSVCNYKCRSKYNLNRHLNTTKHKMKQSETNNEQVDIKPVNIKSNAFYCDQCFLHFKSRTTLWRHKKKHHTNHNIKCSDSNTDLVDQTASGQVSNDKETVKQLMNMLIEQQKDTNKLVNSMAKMVENTKNVSNTNCNNTNNISINMFLNTECKNAMTLTDFVENVKLSLEDLEYTNEHGYIKGISNIFVKNLTDIDPKERPIHCSDTKRMQFYIKDEDEWRKDKNNEKIDKSIDDITNKQIKYIKEWMNQNPDYEKDENKREEYFGLIHELMGGSNKQEQQKNKNKIIKNMSEEVQVKEALND